MDMMSPMSNLIVARSLGKFLYRVGRQFGTSRSKLLVNWY